VPGAAAEEAGVHRCAESGLAQRGDGAVVEQRQEFVHRRQCRAGGGVAAEGEEQKVPRPVGVERRLGVEQQVVLRRGGHLQVGVLLGRDDVLHELASVLGLVADGLPEAAGDGEHPVLARTVLARGSGRRRRSGRNDSCGYAADQQRAGAVAGVAELDECVVDVAW
jgi:hypothetical protein